MALATRRQALALATAATLTTSCRFLTFWRDAEEEERPVTPLAPWHPGLDLRATFETFPPSGDDETKLTLHTENPNAWLARWRLLASSKHALDLSYFILHEDVFGVAFLGHVLERAKSGVRVRLLLDAQGTKMSWKPRGNDYFDELAANENVEIKMYRPLQSRVFEAFLKLEPTAAVASEHDKIIVVDRRESLIGGRNIGVEYFSDPKTDEGHVFEDTDLVLSSRAVAGKLTAAFEAQFESAEAEHEWGDTIGNLQPREAELLGAFRAMDEWLGGKAPSRVADAVDDKAKPWREQLAKFTKLRGALRKNHSELAVPAETRILDSQTRYGEANDPITQALARLVQAAKREILVDTPYLVLSDEAVSLLEAAARRGVRITILTNSPVSSDNALSQAFFLEQWPKILARVPKLRLFVAGEKNTLHSKVVVVDRTLALVGTYNMDPTSMTMNSEVMAAAWSEEFARRAAERPKRMIRAGPPATYEYRIRRDRSGRPLLDGNGDPQIAFGPEQHCDPSQWKTLTAFWTMVRAADKVPGFSPLF